MSISLLRRSEGPALSPISPKLELGAYEAMWLEQGANFKSIATRFAADRTAMPSDFIPSAVALQHAEEVFKHLKKSNVHQFGVRIHHAGDYPLQLRDAKYPVELLYFQGAWELAETPSIAIVGSRKASAEGQKRARQLAKALVAGRSGTGRDGYTIVSGLAAGIDRSAHEAAIEAGGATIGVIGTPLGQSYPKENKLLQEEISQKFLLISQVPILRYSKQAVPQNRLFFPERNATMSALTKGTIIVEAGETSGTLTQARAAIHQGRKLFILNSCFERSDITWPAHYEKQGAIRVRSINDVWRNLD